MGILDDAAGFRMEVTDRPFAPLRFDGGLSADADRFATGDLGVSPDRTCTAWLSWACSGLVRSWLHLQVRRP